MLAPLPSSFFWGGRRGKKDPNDFFCLFIVPPSERVGFGFMNQPSRRLWKDGFRPISRVGEPGSRKMLGLFCFLQEDSGVVSVGYLETGEEGG